MERIEARAMKSNSTHNQMKCAVFDSLYISHGLYLFLSSRLRMVFAIDQWPTCGSSWINVRVECITYLFIVRNCCGTSLHHWRSLKHALWTVMPNITEWSVSFSTRLMPYWITILLQMSSLVQFVWHRRIHEKASCSLHIEPISGLEK